MLRYISGVHRFARYLYSEYLVRKDPVAFARSIGVRLGEGTFVYGCERAVWGSEPYLITIGKHCHIADGVRFITHDGGVVMFRRSHPDLDVVAPITVGDNTLIGMRAVIMPGVRIGSNCIIGCMSLVTRDVPDNTLVAGVPARVVNNVEGYMPKVLQRSTHTGALHGREKENHIRRIFGLAKAEG